MQQANGEPLMLTAEEAPAALVEEAPRFAAMETPELEAGEAIQPDSGREPYPQEESVMAAESEEAPLAALKKTPTVTAPQPSAPPVGVGSGKADVVESMEPDKETQLKNDLSLQVIKNQNALQILLERVPESVKPTLRHAIEITAAGYEQALQNLE
jgi:hypothetical protein